MIIEKNLLEIIYKIFTNFMKEQDIVPTCTWVYENLQKYP